MTRVLVVSALLAAVPAAAHGQDVLVPDRLSLADALRLAGERNPTLAAARSDVEIAEARRVEARLRPNPAVFVDSEGYPLFDSPRPAFIASQELTVRIDQEIELAGRRRLRTEAATAGVAAAGAALANVRRQLDLDVRRAYFAVVLAKLDLDVARSSLDEIDTVLALNRARYQQGEISGVEVRRLQVERLRFVDDRFAADLALRNARGALLALINAPDLSVAFDVTDTLTPRGTSVDAPNIGATSNAVPETVALRATPTPLAHQFTCTPESSPADTNSASAQRVSDAPAPLDITSLRAQALANRPDLLAAQQDVRRADTATRLQRALRTPNVTVGGGYRRNFGTDAVVFGVTVPLPLFNRNQGGIAQADAERRRAEHRAAAVATGVLLDVQQAVNAADISRARVEYIEREYLAPARESRDIVLASYRLGTATLIDFLDAQRAFRDTLRTYNRALYDQRVSQFELDAAVATTPAYVGGSDHLRQGGWLEAFPLSVLRGDRPEAVSLRVLRGGPSSGLRGRRPFGRPNGVDTRRVGCAR